MGGERPYPHGRTRNNQVIQYLREHGAATGDELPYDARNRDRPTREWVGKLQVPGSKSKTKVKGHPTAVYYLYGNIREAVRKFIEVNEDFVRMCMGMESNRINQTKTREVWQMFCEEWVWGGYRDREQDIEEDPGGEVRVRRLQEE